MLGSEFLDAVFAEEAQAGGVGFDYSFGRMHFADSHERNFGVGPVGSAAGCGDLFADAGEIFGERHPTSILWVFEEG